MSRFIVTARALRREDEGDSRQDGRPITSSYFEELSFSVTGDAPVSSIFEKLDRQDAVQIIDVRLFEDLNS